MTDVVLDRQLAHAYIDKLAPEQLAAVRSLLEGMLDLQERKTPRVLGDIGLTLEDFEGLSLN